MDFLNALDEVEDKQHNTQEIQSSIQSSDKQVLGQLQYCIFNNDKDQFIKIMEQHKISPLQELNEQNNLNSLHYVCNQNRPNILLYLLKKVYNMDHQKFENNISQKTKEGWNILSICAIFNSVECMNIIFQAGGIDINILDNQGNSLLDLAEQYGQIDALEIIKNKQLKYFNKDIIPVNKNILVDNQNTFNNLFKSFDINDEDDSKNNSSKYFSHKLVGVKKPCILCNKNKGYLQYTTCCNIPIHVICYKDQQKEQNNINVCKQCQLQNYKISPIITEYEKAFQL